MPSVVLLIRFLMALVATSGVMLKGLAMISPASSGRARMNSMARADDRADEVAACRNCLGRRHSNDVIERRQRFRAGDEHSKFVLHFRPERFGYRSNVDLPEFKRRNHRAKAPGFHKFRILRFEACFL